VKQPISGGILITLAMAALAGWTLQAGAAEPSPSASVSPSPPPSKAGERMEEILKLFETSDYSQIGPLLKNSFAPDFIAAQGERNFTNYLADTVHRSGGIHRGKVNVTGNDAVGFFRSNLTERWGAIMLSVEAAPPYRISSFQITRAKSPPSPPGSVPSSEKKRLAQIAALAEKLAKADLFSGVVAIARNDRPIFTKGYGMADRSFEVPVAPDTRFALSSIDKSITAVAIAQLVEAGKLSYDDPLSKFIAYPDAANAAKIQIKHLLSNTSGLGDYYTDKFYTNVRALRDVPSYVTILDHKAPGFTPGTDWQDSSIGYLLLGSVIESASGEDYYEYVQNHIFKPAGMEHSFQDFLQRANPKAAVRYENYFSADHFVTAIYGYVSPPPARGAPDSATVATAEDVIRFVAALRNGKLVSPATYKLLTTAKPELGAKTYGYGFAMNQASDEGRDIIGEGGDAPGVCTDYALIRDLKEPYTVVVLSNSSTVGHAITEAIVSLYSTMPTQP
jgi:CubicO group peptidase (beta-lactamase class C family)